jgi:hypothetical protein
MLKLKFYLVVILILAGLLTGCNTTSLLTPTPHGDPLAPTAEINNPVSPTPHAAW